MNREQADKIIEVIKTGATGRGAFFPDRVAACIIGDLFLAAGYERSDAEHLLIPEMVLTQYPFLSLLRYNQLVDTNDAHRTVGRRRRALIALVEGWVE